MKTTAIILAAGKGTRFNNKSINKTATAIDGISIIQKGLNNIVGLFDEIYIVVGYKKESVISSVTTNGIHFVIQKKRLGTGHAVRIAIKEIEKKSKSPDQIFITNGDHLFMINRVSIQNLINTHLKKDKDVTLLTCKHLNPEKLNNGRILRKNRKIVNILEKNVLTPKTNKIKELNSGNYIFKYHPLKKCIYDLKLKHGKEIYITDAVLQMKTIGSYTTPFKHIGTGVNTKDELDSYLKSLLIETKYKNNSQPLKFIKLFIVISLFLVLLGKTLVYDGNNFFLIYYGVILTMVLSLTLLVAFNFYQDPFEMALKIANKHPRRKRFLVSCMVAVRNEENNISRCINSIIQQTYQNIEIIVVNDASTDSTPKILHNYEKRHLIKLINLQQNVGKKKALAFAMSIAQGEIFAHTDSDSVWAPDAIEKIVKIFEYFPNVGAVSGHGRAINDNENLLTKVQDSWMEGQFSIRKAFESVFGAVTCVSGPLAVFRKKAIYNFIPAWENDKFLGQEFKFATDRTMTGFVLGSNVVGDAIKKRYKESSFIHKTNFKTREWKVVYCKSAKSWTIVPNTFKKLIIQQVRWKKSFIRNIFFTGSFYWRKPLLASLVYYLHILFVLAGPVIAFRHLIYLPLQGNILSAILYLSGIIFIGFMFGLAHRSEDRNSNHWIYRPVMSLLSTLVISWLIFYSALTIRRMVWTRN